MIRIVFAADSHLNKHYARMTPDQLSTRRQRLRDAWRETIDFAIAQRADLYIHGGDLFDNSNPRAAELVATAREFQRLADAGVQAVLIGGNHDIPKMQQQGATPQRLFEVMRQAKVFTDPTRVTWMPFEKDGTRLAIGGLPPDPRLPRDADPLALLEEPIEPPEADCVLLVTHYAVETLNHPQADEATITKASIAALAGKVDHLLVGHIHHGRSLDVGGVQVIFPGPTERTSFGEIDVRCGFMSLTIEGRRPCRVVDKPMAVNPQPMRRETVRTTDLPAAEATAWIVEQVQGWSAADQILQVRLEGPLSREAYHALDLLQVWQVGHDLNFYFDLDRHGLELIFSELTTEPTGGVRLSPRGEISRAAAAMLAAAGDEDERGLIREARDLVLERYGTIDITDDGAAVAGSAIEALPASRGDASSATPMKASSDDREDGGPALPVTSPDEPGDEALVKDGTATNAAASPKNGQKPDQGGQLEALSFDLGLDAG